MAYARDLLFRSDTGDLDLRSGDIQFVEDIACIAQQIKFRLRFFQGEFFLDLRQGMPYFTQIFAKGASPALLKSVFYNAILNTPGVLQVSQLNVVLVGTALQVQFAAQTQSGPITQVDNLIFPTNPPLRGGK